MAGLLPMIAALERAFGIDEDVSNILRIPHLTVAFADLEERVIGRACLIGRVEQERGSEDRVSVCGDATRQERAPIREGRQRELASAGPVDARVRPASGGGFTSTSPTRVPRLNTSSGATGIGAVSAYTSTRERSAGVEPSLLPDGTAN